MNTTLSLDELARHISANILQSVTDDVTWIFLGYKRRPKRGKLFRRFVSKEKLWLEDSIKRELFLSTWIEYWDILGNLLSIEVHTRINAYILAMFIEEHRSVGRLYKFFQIPDETTAVDFVCQGLVQYACADKPGRTKLFLERISDRVTNRATLARLVTGTAKYYTYWPQSIRIALENYVSESSLTGDIEVIDPRFIRLIEQVKSTI
ncbi:MAG: hypothetical protein P1R58_02385 [bacterium]|nr:hypothetical protein [bacterium]